MPIRYVDAKDNNFIAPVDIGLLDRQKQMDQKRSDVANEEWSKNVQDYLTQGYIDSEARNKYLEEQQNLFQKVITQNSGNLSKGYNDIKRAIETDKTNPYRNLNNIQMTQAALMQQDMLKNGQSEMIVYNNPTKSNLLKDGQYVNPQDLMYKGEKASDYEGSAFRLSQSIQPYITQLEQYADVDPNTPGNVQKIGSKTTQLTPELIKKTYLTPDMWQAFINDNPTATRDIRVVDASGKQYKDIFSNFESWQDWMLGHVIQKRRDDYEGTTKIDKLGKDPSSNGRSSGSILEEPLITNQVSNPFGVFNTKFEDYPGLENVANNIDERNKKGSWLSPLNVTRMSSVNSVSGLDNASSQSKMVPDEQRIAKAKQERKSLENFAKDRDLPIPKTETDYEKLWFELNDLKKNNLSYITQQGFSSAALTEADNTLTRNKSNVIDPKDSNSSSVFDVKENKTSGYVLGYSKEQPFVITVDGSKISDYRHIPAEHIAKPFAELAVDARNMKQFSKFTNSSDGITYYRIQTKNKNNKIIDLVYKSTNSSLSKKDISKKIEKNEGNFGTMRNFFDETNDKIKSSNFTGFGGTQGDTKSLTTDQQKNNGVQISGTVIEINND